MADEGLRAKPYLDSQNILTIGFGTNIGPRDHPTRSRVSTARAPGRNDNETLTGDLPWLSAAPERQQAAILDMGYQLGPRGVLKFHGMLSALESGDCPAAKAAALDSDWARETPKAGRACDRDSVRGLR